MSYQQALIVDDDAVFLAFAEDMLLDAGCVAVETVEEGPAVIARLASGATPDLIVCDLNMPTHDGVSLIRSLAERRYAGKVLIVSGEPNSVIDAVAKLARMQGLRVIGSIKKPMTPLALMAALAGGERGSKKESAEPLTATPSLLDAAIERGALHPFFQPKVSMFDGRVTGAEALARIATSSSDFANPVPYVQLAERNSRIDDLTIAMARAVAKHTRGFLVRNKPLPVSINISPVSLKRLDFPDILKDAVELAGVPASQITLEITETRLLEYEADALDVLTRMRLKGFGLSVDDFGTGYSNIDRLRMFPFTELKIDQSFTQNALSDAFARACVETSVRLAKELGLKVVAEGVETEDMWDLLADLGVDEAQGYLIARPMPASDFAKFLARGAPSIDQYSRRA